MHRLRQVCEEVFHCAWRLQMTLRIGIQQSSRAVQRSLMAKAGEGIKEWLLLLSGIAHTVRGKQRQAKVARAIDASPVGEFLFPAQMTPQFDKDIPSAEASQRRAGVGRVLHQRHHAIRKQGKIFPSRAPFPLRRPQMHAGKQAAEVLVSLPALHQHGNPSAISKRYIAAHQRTQTRLPGRLIETRRPIHSITITKRHSLIAEIGRMGHQVLG